MSSQRSGLAIDDPVKLQRAARILRAALARRQLTLTELTPRQEAGGDG